MQHPFHHSSTQQFNFDHLKVEVLGGLNLIEGHLEPLVERCHATVDDRDGIRGPAALGKSFGFVDLLHDVLRANKLHA